MYLHAVFFLQVLVLKAWKFSASTEESTRRKDSGNTLQCRTQWYSVQSTDSNSKIIYIPTVPWTAFSRKLQFLWRIQAMMDPICPHHPPVFPPRHTRLGISLCYTDTRPSHWVNKLHASHFPPQTWVTLESSFAGMSLPWLQFQWAAVEQAAWTSLQSFLMETSSCMHFLSTHSFPGNWSSLVIGELKIDLLKKSLGKKKMNNIIGEMSPLRFIWLKMNCSEVPLIHEKSTC